MFNYCGQDYDSWKNGWYSRAKERDPGEEYNPYQEKTDNNFEYWKDAIESLAKNLYGGQEIDQDGLKKDLSWLCDEFHIKAPYIK
jgi:hypothetical protein